MNNLSQKIISLKAEIQNSPRSICIERARLLTEFYRDHSLSKDPPVVTRAKAVAYILKRMPVIIYPGELIAGAIMTKRNSAMLYPEFSSLAILPEIRMLGKRKTNAFHIDTKDIDEFEKSIFPFWVEKTVGALAISRIMSKKFSGRLMLSIGNLLNRVFMNLPGSFRGFVFSRVKVDPEKVIIGMKNFEPFRLFSLYGVYVLTEFAGISHITPHYGLLIEKGVSGIIKDINSKLADETDIQKKDFYSAALIVLSGLVRFAERYATEAKRLADAGKDAERKKELLSVAENCGTVPLNPPGSFQQALQSIWLTHLALYQENYDNAISFGRMDQYLYPLYRKGIESGEITPESAREMLQCFWLKICEFLPFYPGKFNEYFSGLLTSQGVCVGGIDEEGRDATNELSHLILGSVRDLATPLPNLFARFNSGTPKEFWKDVYDTVSSGSPHPSIYNDEIIVPSLVKAGCSLKDARDYAPLGCVEPNPQGQTMGSTDAALVNLPLCLELALNNGKSLLMNQQIGPMTGSVEDFKSMEDVVKAVRSQTAYIVEKMVEGTNLLGETHRDYYPAPLLSSFIEGSLETGTDVTGGGARYNFTGVQGVGVADVADSLSAIDWLIFKEKRISLSELAGIVRNNFNGREDLRQLILNKAPRYGRDDESANKYARLAANIYSDEVTKHKNPRGGHYIPGFYSVTAHIAFGKYVSGLPSGRLSGMPLSNGISPAAESSDRGPTAFLNSVSSVDFAQAANGVNLQMGLDPVIINDKRGDELFYLLINGYFKKGGMQVQFNALTSEMLKNAQANPAEYRWLAVRVAGYCAYFTDLSKEAQDEIITRLCRL
jgi:formate C-acetyltransferase